jgi:hypothetical protein
MLCIDFGPVEAHAFLKGEPAMTDDIKLPRMLSEEPDASKPLRPSHQKIIENLDRWANSRELQPPRLPDSKTA